jgi:hypothetical protein
MTDPDIPPPPGSPYGASKPAPVPTPVPASTPAAGWYDFQGRQRWWNGQAWTDDYDPGQQRAEAAQPVYATAQSNGFATAALALGITGFVLMGIPIIGWLIGGVPDILAVIFGIRGISRSGRLGGRGLVPSIVGLGLASVSLFSVLFGAGTIW